MKKSFHRSNGITLIELIAVIGIIGIIYLISVPLYSMFQGTMLLKSTSQGVKNYIEQAKSLAMNYNRSFTVTVDTANQKLTTTDSLTADSGEDLVQKVKDYLVSRQLTISTKSGNEITVSSASTMNGMTIWIQKNGTDKYYTVTTVSSGAVRIYNTKHTD